MNEEGKPDGLITTEMEFPPPAIARWIRNQGVNTYTLVDELRAWADVIEEQSV